MKKAHCEILLTNSFKRAAKKLHRNQIPELEEAIDAIQKDPTLGELKVGDLAGVMVYKFRISNQLVLLAYIYNEQKNEITLISLAPHENFYDDLKKQLSK